MEFETFLKNLKYLYGRNECVEKLFKNFDASPKLQECIVDYILNDELINKFETSRKYQKKFLKTIISSVEKLNEEINPIILEKYIELINSSCTSNYRIYYSKVSKLYG